MLNHDRTEVRRESEQCPQVLINRMNLVNEENVYRIEKGDLDSKEMDK